MASYGNVLYSGALDKGALTICHFRTVLDILFTQHFPSIVLPFSFRFQSPKLFAKMLLYFDYLSANVFTELYAMCAILQILFPVWEIHVDAIFHLFFTYYHFRVTAPTICWSIRYASKMSYNLLQRYPNICKMTGILKIWIYLATQVSPITINFYHTSARKRTPITT
jgi:hypothetical protein